MQIRINIKKGLLFLLLLVSVSTSVNALGWKTLTPDEEDDTYYINLDGIFTYTVPYVSRWQYRHTYSWIHLTGGYELVPNVWISSWVQIEKTSFSYNLSKDPYNFRILPQLSYNNHHNFMTSDTDESGEATKGVTKNINRALKINVNFGTIGDFTHGYGLYFDDFTGVGSHIDLQGKNWSLDATWLGNGYEPNDDLFGIYFYPFRKWIGLGTLLELGNFMGNRVVPGLSFEIKPVNVFRLYGEAGVSYVFNSPYNHDTRFHQWADSYGTVHNLPITMDFHDNITVDEETLAGLAGIDLKISAPSFMDMKASLVNQVRYYGRENSDFYYAQSQVYGFDYFWNLSVNQRYNNQPINFYKTYSETWGVYLRQEITLNVVKNLFIDIKNELLILLPKENRVNLVNGRTVPLITNTATVRFYLTWFDRLDTGIQFSNVTIPGIQRKSEGLPYSDIPGYMLVEDSGQWFIDFYARFYF